MSNKLRFLAQRCDPSLADDRSLPYTSFLVTYKLDGQVCYDIVIANKKTDVFDHYWDHFRSDFITFVQTEGRVNPKLWTPKKQGK